MILDNRLNRFLKHLIFNRSAINKYPAYYVLLTIQLLCIMMITLATIRMVKYLLVCSHIRRLEFLFPAQTSAGSYYYLKPLIFKNVKQ